MHMLTYYTHTHAVTPVLTALGFGHHGAGSTTDRYCHGNQELASLDTTVSPSSAALFSSSPLFLFDLSPSLLPPPPPTVYLTHTHTKQLLLFPHPSNIFSCLSLFTLMTTDCLFCSPSFAPNCYSLGVFHRFLFT